MGTEEMEGHEAGVGVSPCCTLKPKIVGFVNTGTCNPKQCNGRYLDADGELGIVLLYAAGLCWRSNVINMAAA